MANFAHPPAAVERRSKIKQKTENTAKTAKIVGPLISLDYS